MEDKLAYPAGAAGFGVRLGLARRGLGDFRGRDVSKAELGEHVGLSGQTVGMWESGETKTDIETIERLAIYLQVEPGWLAFGRGPRRLLLPVDDSETGGLDIERGRRRRGEPPPANPEDEQSGGSGQRGA